MHQKLGVTCYHEPAMTMQASDFACRNTAISFYDVPLLEATPSTHASLFYTLVHVVRTMLL